MREAKTTLGSCCATAMEYPPTWNKPFGGFVRQRSSVALSDRLNLARMYLTGLGVPEDKDEAERWFRAAADQGYTPESLIEPLTLITRDGPN